MAINDKTLAHSLGYHTCRDGHLHLIAYNQDGKEIADIQFNDARMAADFSIEFAYACVNVFGPQLDKQASREPEGILQ